MAIRYLLILLALFFTNCKKAGDSLPEAASFTNPVLSKGPDPWIIQKDSFYYYTNTTGNSIELWKTKSISRLNLAVCKKVWTPPASGPNSHHIWAPELHFLDGKWYLYYTAGPSAHPANQRLFVLENSSADPMAGTWEDKGQLADPDADFFAIDATILEHNKKRYLLWSSVKSPVDDDQHIYIAELSNPWTLATKRSLISSAVFKWERMGAPLVKAVNEAPQILKNNDGSVFMFFSACNCWSDDYTIGYMTLKKDGDPMVASDWIKNPTPIMATNPESNAFGPGHNAFFKSPDGKEDWLIYHANNEPGQQCSDFRNPRIQPFKWNSDGTPDFGMPVAINKRLLRPSGEKD